MSNHLADSIVERIHANTLRSIASFIEDNNLWNRAHDIEGEEHDSWNEGQHGADWCYNEICLFQDLYEIVYPDDENGLSGARVCHSVAEILVFLRTLSEPILNSLFRFCENGGSDNPRYFELRDNEDVNGIIGSLFT